MAITCVILDDEPPAITRMERFIAKISSLVLVTSFTDPHEAVLYLQATEINLIFVDVEMPNSNIDGMDVIRILGEQRNYIVTTGHPQYALDAFDNSVIDYLNKPFKFDRFAKAVQKATKIIGGPAVGTVPDDHSFVRVDGKYQRIDFNSVCWIESDRNNTSMVTEEGSVNLHLSITEVEKQLPVALFIRVHKSYIVAISKMHTVETNTVFIRRKDQLRPIPVGETYRKALIETVTRNAIMKR